MPSIELLRGCSQGELIKWYMDEQNRLGAFASTDAMALELKLVKTIINHLIKKEQVLQVIEEPMETEDAEAEAGEEGAEGAEGEGEGERAAAAVDPKEAARRRARAAEKRLLALDPNYVF